MQPQPLSNSSSNGAKPSQSNSGPDLGVALKQRGLTSSLETTAGQLVSTKVDALLDSCDRVRLQGHEAVSWSVLLEDFCALSTSLGLLRDACPVSFNALAVVPHEVRADVGSIAAIPDALSAFPGDDAYEEVRELMDALKKAGVIGGTRLLAAQDVKQLRLNIQSFNRDIDSARSVLQRAAAEASGPIAEVSKVTTLLQPLKPKPAQQRKDYETLYAILTRLYRGTGLMPAPLET